MNATTISASSLPTTLPPSSTSIEEAKYPFHIETPLLRSSTLSSLVNASVYLKCELLQPSGSFKIRGVGLRCQREFDKGARKLVASSGGNAGLAVAYVGARLQIPVTIVVPTTTPQVDKIKAEGAEVKVHGNVWDEADVEARRIVSTENAAYIHPFDHADLWEGISSIIIEMKDNNEFRNSPPDMVICSVGGGGMLSGICHGLEQVGWKDTLVVAVETQGANCFAAGLKAGSPVPVKISSIAKSLAPTTVAVNALLWAKKRKIISLEVSDKSVVEACSQFLDDHRMLVEAACAASLVPIYEKLILEYKPKSVIVILCGGSAISFNQLLEWKRSFLGVP